MERQLEATRQALAILWAHHAVVLQVLLVGHDESGRWVAVGPPTTAGPGVDVVDQEAEAHDLIKAASISDGVDNEEAIAPPDLLLDQQGVFLL